MDMDANQTKALALNSGNGKLDLTNILILSIYNYLKSPTDEAFFFVKWFVSKLRRYVCQLKGSGTVVPEADVVFSITEITHYTQLKPIAQELAKMGVSFLFVSNRERLLRSIESHGHKVLFIESLSLDPSIPKVHFNQELLRGSCERVGVEFGVLRRFILLRKAMVECHVARCKRLLILSKAKVVVVGNDQTWQNRALVLYAKTRHLETIAVQHGSLSVEPFNGLFTSDKWLVFGEKARRMLAESGVRYGDIVVTGAPYLDALSAVDFTRPNETIEREVLKGAQNFVLVALSGVGKSTSANHYFALVKSLVSLMKSRPHVRFVVKMHRKDRSRLFYSMTEELNLSNVEIVGPDSQLPTNSIFDWMKGCRLVISGVSSIVFEGLLAGVPVISHDLAGEYSSFPYLKEGIIMRSTSEELLFKLFDDSMRGQYPFTPEERANYVDSYFFNSDGGASRRCAEVVRDCISSSSF